MNTCSNAPVSGVTIQPKHAVSLIPGDIVKLTPSDRRRVVTVADNPNSVYVTGEWEVLTGPTPRREPFTAAFCRFFTVEAVQDAR